MYKRDVAILIVACFAVIFSLQHEGRVSVRKAWYHLYEDEDPDLFSGQSKLPPPVVGDLNGDGDLEVILATHDYKLEVVKPRHAGRSGDGFAKAHVLASVSLLPSKVAVAGTRRPAALAVGYLDPAPAEMVRAPRKQVVVVVTAGWHVMCYDHNLKLLWEHSAIDNLPHHAQLEEVAIHVSHHQVHAGDRGLIVVGGALLMGDLGHPDTQEQLLQEQLHDDEDGVEPDAVDSEGRRLHGAASRPVPAAAGGSDTSRHFSYFAYEGASGKEVWKHDASFLHAAADLEDLADEMHPQENYKLEAESLEGRHFQEASCRAYAGSVLHAMPHSWSSTQDTHLEEAHFVKHREAAGAQKQALGRPNKPARGGRSAHSASPKLAGIVHKPHLTSLLRPADNLAAHAARAHAHPNGTKANALVAHLREGIEVIHLYTGRTICQLHLADTMLHVDIDGDGVLDHVQSYTGSDSVALGSVGGAASHHHATHCTAAVTSGIPPRHHSWSARVCNLESFDLMERVRAQGGMAGGGGQAPDAILPPAFLPVPRLDGSYARRGRQHGILVFMTNRGEVTALDTQGGVLWSEFYSSGWDPVPGGLGPVPTLKAIALRPHAIPSAILVAGAYSASLLSEHGTEVDEFALPSPPLHPLVVGDFNGDGLNDFMLVSQRGVFGYQQVHHLGGYSFSALVMTLVIAMGVVYFMQQGEGGATRGKKVRSTEFMD